MLFARGKRSLTSLFATHPPLVQRIQALDPSFREADFPQVPARPQTGYQAAGEREFADTPSAAVSDDAPGQVAEGSLIAASVGNPGLEQVDFARQLRASIPDSLYEAAHAESTALLLTLALVLDRTGSHAERQFNLIAEQLGRDRASMVRRYYGQLVDAGVAYRLPLLEIAFPALKRRPEPQLTFLVDLVRRLVETDGEIDLVEYCFYQVLVGNLRQSRSASAGRVSRSTARQAALQLIRIVADHGHRDPADREAARRAGRSQLGSWAAAGQAEADASADTVAELDRCLSVLRRIDPGGRESLVRALSATVAHDNRMSVIEAELLRAVCAGLDCPLPPLITANPTAPTELGGSPGGAHRQTPNAHERSATQKG
jgi:hypothetical protein